MEMLKALTRKFWRPLLAIGATCALGIAVMVGLSGGCLSLEASTLDYLQTYRYFDACITTEVTAEDKLDALSVVPGIEHAEARMAANTVMYGTSGRILSIRAITYAPDDWQRFQVWESVATEGRDTVLVEYEFALANGILAGDELSIRVGDEYRPCVVEGLVSAPETLSVRAFDNASSLNSDFGYVYVPIRLVEREPNPDRNDALHTLDDREAELDEAQQTARQAYEEAIAELDKARIELERKLQEVYAALGEADALRTTLDGGEATAQDALGLLDEARGELNRTRAQLDTLYQQLLDAIAQAKNARNTLATRRAEVVQTRAELAAQRAELEDTVARLEQAKRALAQIDEGLELAQAVRRMVADKDVSSVVGILSQLDPDITLPTIAQGAQALDEFRTLCEEYGITSVSPSTIQEVVDALLKAMDDVDADWQLLNDPASDELASLIEAGDEEARSSEQGQQLARAVGHYGLTTLTKESLESARTRCGYLRELRDNYRLREMAQRISELPNISYDQWQSALKTLTNYANQLGTLLGDEFARIDTVGQLLDAYRRLPDALDATIADLEAQRAQIVAQLAEADVGEKDIDTTLNLLRSSIAALSDAIAQADEGLSAIDAALGQANDAVSTLGDKLSQVDDGLAEIEGNERLLGDKLQEAYDALARIEAARAELESAEREAQDGLDTLDALGSQLESKRYDAEDQWLQGLVEFSHLREELAQARAELDEWKGYGAFHNQFLLWFAAGADPETTLAAAEATLAPTQVKSSYAYADSPVKRRLDDNIVPLRSLSYFMPAVFFGVVLIVAFLFMSLIVRQSRTNIGVLRALGKGTGYIRALFCGLGLLVAAAAVPLGLALGYGLVRYTADYYIDFFKLPSVSCRFDIAMLLAATLLTVVVVQLATLVGTQLISSIQPSEALARSLPSATRVPKVVGWLTAHLDELDKFSVVSLLRNPVRLAFSVACIAASAAIIFAAQSFLASKNYLVYQEFEQRLHYDAQLFFSEEPSDELLGELDAFDYVSDAQRVGFYSCTIRCGSLSLEATVEALQQGSDLVGIHDNRGRRLEVPEQGIILDAHTAQRLGATVGSIVFVDGVPLRVQALSRQDVGRVQYLSLEQADALGAGTLGCVICRILPDGQQELLHELSKRDDYVFAVFTDVLYDSSAQLYATYDLSAWILTSFAVAIGALVMLNVMQTNMLERKRELCVLRTLGFAHRRLSRALFCQTMLYVALACLVGLPIGKAVALRALALISTPNRSFAYANGLREYTTTATIVLGYAVASHFLAMRVMRHWDINEGVRDKE